MIALAALLLGLAADASSSPLRSAAVRACTTEVRQHADEGAAHAQECSPLRFGSNPPSSGAHYPSWAQYKTYAATVPAGYLVHSLEHGALVIGYNCPEGCASEVGQVQAWINGLGQDPLCPGSPYKIILAPDPGLEVRWAAAAWTWTWKASCPDTASLSLFFQAHYGKTLEAGVCGGGVDKSAGGWCALSVNPRVGETKASRGAPDPSLLWSGSLPGRSRLRVEAALPDGTLLETVDLGEAGPGPARATWDGRAFRMRHPGAGTVILLVRTASGRLLARRIVPAPER